MRHLFIAPLLSGNHDFLTHDIVALGRLYELSDIFSPETLEEFPTFIGALPLPDGKLVDISIYNHDSFDAPKTSRLARHNGVTYTYPNAFQKISFSKNKVTEDDLRILGILRNLPPDTPIFLMLIEI